MLNYIVADLRRIYKKRSFMFAIFSYIALYFIMIFILNNPTFTPNSFVHKTEVFVDFLPLFYGLPIFMSVFYDDFKSKTMQIAIGYGFSRTKVLLSKIFESIFIAFAACFLLFGLILGVSLCIKLPLISEQIFELLGEIFVVAMRIVGYTCMSAVVVYATQRAVSGVILFVMLASQLVMILLTLVLSQDIIISLFGNLSSYLYTSAVYVIKESLVANQMIPIASILTVTAYIALSIVASIIAFSKKELEF